MFSLLSISTDNYDIPIWANFILSSADRKLSPEWNTKFHLDKR